MQVILKSILPEENVAHIFVFKFFKPLSPAGRQYFHSTIWRYSGIGVDILRAVGRAKITGFQFDIQIFHNLFFGSIMSCWIRKCLEGKLKHPFQRFTVTHRNSTLTWITTHSFKQQFLTWLSIFPRIPLKVSRTFISTNLTLKESTNRIWLRTICTVILLK